MKTTFYFLSVCMLLLNGFPFLAQESEKPFVVSPLIGDTLSLDERDHYNVLPTIKGFQFAIFYLNSDSLLDVKVSYENQNKLIDTIIINYKSLDNLRIQLLKTDVGKCREVTAYLLYNTNISGGFLSINNQSVLIYADECDEGNLSSICFKKIQNEEIKKFVIPGESNIGESLVWFTIIGFAAGSTIASLYVINENTSGWEELKAGVVFASGLVGACVGLLTSIIYGSITSEPDLVIQPFSEDNIEGLRQYSVYPDGIPDELKKIK